MFKKIISLFLAIMMLVVMIPSNAYAGTAIAAMDNVSMNQHYQYQDISFNFNDPNTQLPRKGAGPLYDDIFFTDESVYWTRKVDKDGTGYVTPGERPTGSFGFCVDLKKSKLLGAVRKGDLYADCTVRARNYDLDGDISRSVIIPYPIGGYYVKEYASADHDNNSSWGDVTVNSPQITKDAYYLVFSAYGERKGGAANKNLNFDVNSIYGKITDKVGPKVVSISDTATVNGKQYIRQDINKNDPSIYITMDEDCKFNAGSKVLLETNKFGIHEMSAELIYVGEVSSDDSTGHVTYKFRIKLTDPYDSLNGYHYYKVKLDILNTYDTMGNFISQSRQELNNIQCNKFIDMKQPNSTYISDYKINEIEITDEYGLSSVSYELKLRGTDTVLSVNKFTAGDLENISVSDATKSVPIELSKAIISKTGVYDLTTKSADLANNSITHVANDIFLISDNDPIKMTLNKNDAKLNLSPEDISSETKDALTTMTLVANSSVVPAWRLGEAKIYYRWLSAKDDQVITKFNEEKSQWKEVSFKSNSNETQPLTIPVDFVSDGTAEYLVPKFQEGYLYVIPYMADSISSYSYRTGSMALGGYTADGKFKTIESNPLIGEFVDRGCQCTGTTPSGINAEAHYMAIRNHTEDIGFDVDMADNSNLDKIMWSIKRADTEKVLIASGTIENSTSNEYNIPIDSVKEKTGSYIVTAALYSNTGDVTVRRMELNIESPIIGISSILYNQETQSLDFTVSYNQESTELSDIIIEICDKDTTEYKDEIKPENGSIYEASYVASKDELSAQLFAGTEFKQDSNNKKLMRANFRANLTNMEKSGDSFVKMSGEKRVHLKYVTSNNVTVVNNNIAVIKKSNIPPSITMDDLEISNKYNTASAYNNDLNPLIKVSVEEPLGELETLKYGWVDNPNTSLVTTGGAIGGELVSLEIDKKEKLFYPIVPKVEGENSELYKIKYLSVYADNSFGKSSEKIFGPFYVLHENINDKRFLITVNDKVLGDKEALVAVDDRLYYIDELQKPDRMRVTWEEASDANNKVTKEYDLSFTSNFALVNLKYPELWDTDGKGGTYKLSNIEIYNNSNPGSSVKTAGPFEIAQTLQEYYVKINSSMDKSFLVSSSQDNTNIEYGWSSDKYDMPSLTSTMTGITGTKITLDDKGSLLNKLSYLFVKAWNTVFRSGALELQPSTAESIGIEDIVIGEISKEENGKASAPIRITVSNTSDINKIVSLDVYDKFSATSSTAIKVNKVYKLSDNQVFTLLPALTTSGGAIKCSVSVNEVDRGDYSANIDSSLKNPLNYTYANKTITLDSSVAVSDYQYYKVYDGYGRVYSFVGNKVEIFENGTYLIAYKNLNKFYAEFIDVMDISYSVSDIQILMTPEKGNNNVPSVTATMTMPLGSIIKDKYGVLTNVMIEGDRVKAEALFSRNAKYTFNVEFPNEDIADYEVNIDYIDESYVPLISASTSSTAITYDPTGTLLTSKDVKAMLNDSIKALNNLGSNEYIFNSNGLYSFVAKEDGLLVEHKAIVNWIDKKCPEPTITKFVWYDKDSDKIADEGEKTVVIPSGYKTKHNVIVEITFPYVDNARPVMLSGSSNFAAVEEFRWDANPAYAYKYIFAYSPEGVDTLLVEQLTFEDTLGNKTDYTLIIDEIDRAALLTQLVYSTMDYTNRDVIVSMLSNKAIMRFENVEAVDADGIVTVVEKEAPPTYIFKENGSKDFNYRELHYVEGAEEGKLTANVTWIDKNVPDVIIDYDSSLTKSTVEINFKVINGSLEGAKLRCGFVPITLTASGADLIGSLTVSENDRYIFTVSTKYGNTATFIVPITNIDTTSPEISIIGREEVYIKLGERYYDKGATAFDNRDKDITKAVKVQSNVNTSIASGSDYYQVIYSVSDEAGNTSSKIRKVHVLDVNSAVAIVENNIINLLSQATHDVKITDSGVVYLEFVGVDGTYTAKYQEGDKDSAGNEYDNAYFKKNGRLLSKTGTVAVSKGIYTFHLMDQERNTRIFKINFN